MKIWFSIEKSEILDRMNERETEKNKHQRHLQIVIRET